MYTKYNSVYSKYNSTVYSKYSNTAYSTTKKSRNKVNLKKEISHRKYHTPPLTLTCTHAHMHSRSHSHSHSPFTLTLTNSNRTNTEKLETPQNRSRTLTSQRTNKFTPKQDEKTQKSLGFAASHQQTTKTQWDTGRASHQEDPHSETRMSERTAPTLEHTHDNEGYRYRITTNRKNTMQHRVYMMWWLILWWCNIHWCCVRARMLFHICWDYGAEELSAHAHLCTHH